MHFLQLNCSNITTSGDAQRHHYYLISQTSFALTAVCLKCAGASGGCGENTSIWLSGPLLTRSAAARLQTSTLHGECVSSSSSFSWFAASTAAIKLESPCIISPGNAHVTYCWQHDYISLVFSVSVDKMCVLNNVPYSSCLKESGINLIWGPAFCLLLSPLKRCTPSLHLLKT